MVAIVFGHENPTFLAKSDKKGPKCTYVSYFDDFFQYWGKLYWRIIDVFLGFQYQHCHLVMFVCHIALYQHCSLQEDRRGREFGIT